MRCEAGWGTGPLPGRLGAQGPRLSCRLLRAIPGKNSSFGCRASKIPGKKQDFWAQRGQHPWKETAVVGAGRAKSLKKTALLGAERTKSLEKRALGIIRLQFQFQCCSSPEFITWLERNLVTATIFLGIAIVTNGRARKEKPPKGNKNKKRSQLDNSDFRNFGQDISTQKLLSNYFLKYVISISTRNVFGINIDLLSGIRVVKCKNGFTKSIPWTKKP